MKENWSEEVSERDWWQRGKERWLLSGLVEEWMTRLICLEKWYDCSGTISSYLYEKIIILYYEIFLKNMSQAYFLIVIINV